MQVACIFNTYAYTILMRTSASSQKIIDLFARHHLLTMKDIHGHISDVNFSTIFRNVEQLHKDGVLKKVMIDKDTIAYEKADHAHDHVVCDSCGDIQAISIRDEIQTQSLATISDIIIRGICTACTEA